MFRLRSPRLPVRYVDIADGRRHTRSAADVRADALAVSAQPPRDRRRPRDAGRDRRTERDALRHARDRVGPPRCRSCRCTPRHRPTRSTLILRGESRGGAAGRVPTDPRRPGPSVEIPADRVVLPGCAARGGPRLGRSDRRSRGRAGDRTGTRRPRRRRDAPLTSGTTGFPKGVAFTHGQLVDGRDDRVVGAVAGAHEAGRVRVVPPDEPRGRGDHGHLRAVRDAGAGRDRVRRGHPRCAGRPPCGPPDRVLLGPRGSTRRSGSGSRAAGPAGGSSRCGTGPRSARWVGGPQERVPSRGAGPVRTAHRRVGRGAGRPARAFPRARRRGPRRLRAHRGAAAHAESSGRNRIGTAGEPLREPPCGSRRTARSSRGDPR